VAQPRIIGDGDPSKRLQPVVMTHHDAEVVDRGAGVSTVYLVDPSIGAEEFLSGVTEFAAGASLPFHLHNCEENVIVIEGLATFECEGRSVPLDVGDRDLASTGADSPVRHPGSTRTRIQWTYGWVDATRTLADGGTVATVRRVMQNRMESTDTDVVAPKEWHGRYFEDFAVGDVYRSRLGRTISEVDNTWFTTVTMNTNQVHFNADFAGRTRFRKLLVNSCLTLSLVTGLSAPDTSENATVNVSWSDIKLPRPVFVGDTLYAESEILATRPSQSNRDASASPVSRSGSAGARCSSTWRGSSKGIGGACIWAGAFS
jgi:itaconyl-CoA hydratase